MHTSAFFPHAPPVSPVCTQAALTRRARRLHVGNLPSGLEPEALKELFNSTMRAAKLTIDDNLAAGCVSNISMATDNRFCFVEFKTIELATACASRVVQSKPLLEHRIVVVLDHLGLTQVRPRARARLARDFGKGRGGTQAHPTKTANNF